MKFHLSIDMGNEAMQTGEDIAAALRWTADNVENLVQHTTDETGVHHAEEDSANIYDLNGNKVGACKVSKWAC